MRTFRWMLAAAAIVVAISAAAPWHSTPAPARHAAPADSVIVRVTSLSATDPVTFEARYLLPGGAPTLPPGGEIAPRATPYVLAMPASDFQGLFRQVGGTGRMHVELELRRDGRAAGTASSDAPIALVVATAGGAVGATGF